MTNKGGYGRGWIKEKGIDIVGEYGGEITLRALHYRLVSLGMPNTVQHYKRVISAMTDARWKGEVEFDDFKDHERELIGETKAEITELEDEIERAIKQIGLWMESYYLNKWENQPYYVEVWIEKKALIGAFKSPCYDYSTALFPCKGYPSLTWLYEAKTRFGEAEARNQEVIILYFGDYDPSGEDIPRSIQDNLEKMGSDIEVERIALLEEQVTEWQLPPAPTKTTDTRSFTWDGIGQVELDAIEPRQLQQLCKDAISKYFDAELNKELIERQSEERIEYQQRVKEWVTNYQDNEGE